MDTSFNNNHIIQRFVSNITKVGNINYQTKKKKLLALNCENCVDNIFKCLVEKNEH